MGKSESFSYRRELKEILRLATPIYLTQFSLLGISIVTTVMVSKLGAEAISGLGLASVVVSSIIVFGYNLLSPISTFINQDMGSEKYENITGHIHQGFWLGLIISIFIFLLFFFANTLLENSYIKFWVRDQNGNEGERILKYMGDYFFYMAFSIPLIINLILLRAILEGIKSTIPIFLISFGSFILNIPLSYVFIYGLPMIGFEGWEVKGAAFANTVVHSCRFLSIALYIFYIRKKIPFKIFGILDKIAWGRVMGILKIGLPIAFAFLVETLILGSTGYLLFSLGANVISGVQISQNFWLFSYQIPMSFNIGFSICLSRYIGSREFTKVRKLIRLNFISTFIFSSLLSFLIYIFSDKIAKLYSSDILINYESSFYIQLVGMIILIDCFQAIFSSIQRCHKDTLFSMLLYMGIYILYIPIFYLMAFGHLGFPYIGKGSIHFGFIMALLTICIILYFRSRRHIRKYKDEKYVEWLTNNG